MDSEGANELNRFAESTPNCGCGRSRKGMKRSHVTDRSKPVLFRLGNQLVDGVLEDKESPLAFTKARQQHLQLVVLLEQFLIDVTVSDHRDDRELFASVVVFVDPRVLHPPKALFPDFAIF